VFPQLTDLELSYIEMVNVTVKKSDASDFCGYSRKSGVFVCSPRSIDDVGEYTVRVKLDG